jgi:DNA-directed RNA polymerase subunit omega
LFAPYTHTNTVPTEGEYTLSIPLDTLIDKQTNVYEMTCVAIKEATILSSPNGGGREIEENNGKIVSTVLERVLNDEIEYTFDNKD